jgi:hypothetical protein
VSIYTVTVRVIVESDDGIRDTVGAAVAALAQDMVQVGARTGNGHELAIRSATVVSSREGATSMISIKYRINGVLMRMRWPWTEAGNARARIDALRQSGIEVTVRGLR